MRNRWMAVVLGAAVLAVPGTALAKGDHGKGHGKEKAKSHQKAEKQRGKKDKAKKDKKAAKGKSFVFKGVYEGGGVVAVTSGNGRVRKGGFVGRDVTFDLSAAKLVVADSDGVAGISADDVRAGDKVLVQARLPRGTKAPAKASRDEEPAGEEAPAAFKARKLIVLSRAPVADDDSAEDGDEDEAEDDFEEVEDEQEPEDEPELAEED